MQTEEHEVLKLERAALARWGAGDPSGYLELYAEDISYFDPFHKERIDGLAAMTTLYESLRGQVHVDSCEIVGPRVQELGELAILTFVDVGEAGGKLWRWNATEVYRKGPSGWKIVHANWSYQA
jgi:ketosteroid isomerase-like protein